MSTKGQLTTVLAALTAILAGAKEVLSHAFELADAYEHRVKRYFRHALRVERQPAGSARRYVAAQVETVLTVVVLGLIIVIGILIYSQVQTTVFPNVDTDTANNTRLENASSAATEDFGSAMELAPVIMIVLIAAVVLGVVQRFR